MNKFTSIGTVGLGLMGCSIATCLLIAGHTVKSLEKDPTQVNKAERKIREFLEELKKEGVLNGNPGEILQRFTSTDDPNELSAMELVIETITENLESKKNLYHQLEEVLAPTAVIGSNTSAIPVTQLQSGLKHPERLIGIHWAEPAHITRFMEVICGNQTNPEYAQEIMKLAESWGKEPSLLKKDIRGFITNRIMYAMMREAFYLLENGYATAEDIDRSVRNDLGYWITFAGPFRYMDITGIPAYLTVMQDLFPELSNEKYAPAFMENLVTSGARGVSNARGFYPYTKESAEKWKKDFIEFSYDIRKLAEKYKRSDQ